MTALCFCNYLLRPSVLHNGSNEIETGTLMYLNFLVQVSSVWWGNKAVGQRKQSEYKTQSKLHQPFEVCHSEEPVNLKPKTINT